MQLEVGAIVEGKVTGFTAFGAFVDLEGGKKGMVHISEVALEFVKDIKDSQSHYITPTLYNVLIIPQIIS